MNFEAERISAQIGVHIPLDAGITVNLEENEKGPEAFNIQPVIESVRKQVKFHNNSILASQKGGNVALEGNGKIEGAIQFYFRYPFVGSKIHRALQGLLTNPKGIGGLDGSYTPHLNSEQAFVDMFGENGFNQLGAFLRSLSAWYSLRDCERLLEETIDRFTFVAAGNNVRTDLAAMHCGFNLNDASRVLSEAEVSSLYASVANRAQNIKKRMEKAVAQGNINTLIAMKAEIVDLRTQIATTIELP
ncbi:MAG: hypothetical protein GQ529_12710 [Methyloprofundus sp.]|nr:hypothetical protein [Methyloprofundus sp.]